jgi:hypothetical protein
VLRLRDIHDRRRGNVHDRWRGNIQRIAGGVLATLATT